MVNAAFRAPAPRLRAAPSLEAGPTNSPQEARMAEPEDGIEELVFVLAG